MSRSSSRETGRGDWPPFSAAAAWCARASRAPVAVNALTALVRVVDLGVDARRPLTNPQIVDISRWRTRDEPLAATTARAEAARQARRVVAVDEQLAANHKTMEAGLIRRPRRGFAAITDRGEQFLAEHSGPINGRALEQFPEFVEFKTLRHNKTSSTAPSHNGPTMGAAAVAGSPTEAIHALVDEANAAVAAEVLERILEQAPVSSNAWFSSC